MLEEVFILPVDKERQLTGCGKCQQKKAADHRNSLMENPLALQKVCITALSRAHTHKHTPWYLAGGTSSTGPKDVCVSSTQESPEPL